MKNKEPYKKLAITITKFATSSAIATAVDICLFMFVFYPILNIFLAEFFSGFIGMIINFYLQKKYVFKLNRNAYIAFSLSIFFSLIALLIGSLLMKGLVTIPILATYVIIPKIMVIGFKFFFNFFTKKWIFEKK